MFTHSLPSSRRRVLPFLAAVSLLGCTSGGSIAGNRIASVVVSPQNAVVSVNATLQLVATVTGSGGETLNQGVSWSSATPAVATVTSDGLVRGVAPGSVTITASAGGVTGSVVVAVQPQVSTITITPASPASVIAEQTLQLVATPRDAAGAALSGVTFTWASANFTIATVSQTGVVTGVAPGTVQISATSAGVGGSVTLTVLPRIATIELTPVAPVIGLLEAFQLTATPRAADGTALTGRTFTWSSATGSIASVSSTGVVTGLGLGTASISASAEGRTGATNVQVANISTTGNWAGTMSVSNVTWTVTYSLQETSNRTVGGSFTIRNPTTNFPTGTAAGTRTNTYTVTVTSTVPGFIPFTFLGAMAANGTTMQGVFNGSGFLNQNITLTRTSLQAAVSREPAASMLRAEPAGVGPGTSPRRLLDAMRGLP